MQEKQMETPERSAVAVKAIGPEQCRKFTSILERYKAGKKRQDQRVIDSEKWWKLRNAREDWGEVDPLKDFEAHSGWLHNVIVSKHADAMEAYPEPNILPREPGDRQEATRLSSILPLILEQNDFESTYSAANWDKLKSGTCVYKVVWDQSRLHGLGDISIEAVNLLNIFWEPGVTDIQKSRYFFHTELVDREVLEQIYPELKGTLKGNTIQTAQYAYDDHVSAEGKVTVVEVYYKKWDGGRQVLHYCKYVEDHVIYATENETEAETDELGNFLGEPYAQRGLYDHGRYPYVFDALFPVKGTPCGYGFVDLCRSPQTEIDLLQTAFVANSIENSTPRYFYREDGSVNAEDFLDRRKKLVPVDGNLGEDSLRRIESPMMSSTNLSFLEAVITELRETSGNTETSTGAVSSGVTAASAIAALQEAAGKGSKDANRSAYRAFAGVVDLCIELIRQFYTAPRSFRITGRYGEEGFAEYSNAGLLPQSMGDDFGTGELWRMPVFDISVSAQKASAYTTISQNELALQFFQLGFFNPQMTDQALMCLNMMDFDTKDETMQQVARNGTMYQKLIQAQQLALALAQQYEPDKVPALAAAFTGQAIQSQVPQGASFSAEATRGDQMSVDSRETSRVRNAREQAQEASQPDEHRVIAERG